MSEYIPINDLPAARNLPPVPPVTLGLSLHVPLAAPVSNDIADTPIEPLKSQ